MFTNIIIAVDGSDHADHAIKVACDIAKHYNAYVHLVHTPQVDTTALAVGAAAYVLQPPLEDIQNAGKLVMERAVKACDTYGTTPKSTTIGRGVPAIEVLTAAKDHNGDLIVCGRRGLGSLTSLVLGSTSSKIAHDADCAVLTVK